MARKGLYPVSVDPGFPVLPPTPRGWRVATFDDVLEQVQRRVELDPATPYVQVVAKRSRGGIERRGEVPGREILTKVQFETRTGDFLISKRQIIHGACGVVPASLDRSIVSGEYATLRPRDGLSLDFLRHYSHTPYFQRTCFHSSHGVDVEKMVFKLEQWLKREVALPPLGEQRKIAAILSSVDEAIEATQAVIDQVQVVKKGLMQELLTKGLPGRHKEFKQTEIGEIPATWEVVELGHALSAIESGWSPKCESRPASTDEWGVLKVSAVSWGEFRPHENKALGADLTSRISDEVQAGDLLLSRANTRALVGRVVLVPRCRPRLLLSDKLLRLRPRSGVATSEYLFEALQMPLVREQIEDGATGSSLSMKNISQEKLKRVRVPLPPFGEQAEAVRGGRALMDRLRSESNALQALADLKAALLSALLTGEVRVTP